MRRYDTDSSDWTFWRAVRFLVCAPILLVVACLGVAYFTVMLWIDEGVWTWHQD